MDLDLSLQVATLAGVVITLAGGIWAAARGWATIRSELRHVQERLDRVYRAIHGNGREGLEQRVQKLERRDAYSAGRRVGDKAKQHQNGGKE